MILTNFNHCLIISLFLHLRTVNCTWPILHSVFWHFFYLQFWICFNTNIYIMFANFPTFIILFWCQRQTSLKLLNNQYVFFNAGAAVLANVKQRINVMQNSDNAPSVSINICIKRDTYTTQFFAGLAFCMLVHVFSTSFSVNFAVHR